MIVCMSVSITFLNIIKSVDEELHVDIQGRVCPQLGPHTSKSLGPLPSGVKSAPANPAGRGGADLKGRPKGARPGARRALGTREVLSTPEGRLVDFQWRQDVSSPQPKRSKGLKLPFSYPILDSGCFHHLLSSKCFV